MILTYNIQTAVGQLTKWKDSLPFLTTEELKEFNTIGYTGKNSEGKRTTRQEYLNSLNKGEFSVRLTKGDSGDFVEEFSIVRVLPDEKKNNTLDYINENPDTFKVYATHQTEGPVEWLFKSAFHKYRISHSVGVLLSHNALNALCNVSIRLRSDSHINPIFYPNIIRYRIRSFNLYYNLPTMLSKSR